ncbi:MAG TPA: PAS domain-containing protein [Stellaceae bacterium]|nr:PAS domain-containing protein [Stellaceae bacterium]
MPYGSDRESTELSAPVAPNPESAVPRERSPLKLPGWMQALSAASVLLSLAALSISALLFTAIIEVGPGQPTALSLAGLAVLCGVAAAVARLVYSGFSGRVELLSRALEASADAHIIIAPDGRTAYSNAAFRRFFGTPRRPLDALSRLIAADGAAAQEFARLNRDVAASGSASGRIAVARGRGEAWFGVTAHRLDGGPDFTVWSFTDVTARHEMEQVIRDEQMKLADFLDNAPVGFYSVDEEGRFLFVNAALAEWLGATPGELADGEARLADFLAVPPPPGVSPHAPFAGEGGGEVVLEGRQGRCYDVLITQSVVRAGTSLRTRSVVRNLTPEHEWEEALQHSRLRFQHIFVDAPVGIALLDREGRIEEANHALGRLFARAPSELIGQKLAGLLAPSDGVEMAAKLDAVSSGAASAGPVEIRLRGGGTRERSAAVVVSRLAGVASGEIGLILHFFDTSERKSLEAQFAQSQKMQAVGQLAGGVAHDFNNLLTAIIGFCDLLLLRFQARDPSFADIMQIKQNANRAANLVRQLLAFSRQQSLQPRILNITDVLAELSHLLRRLIGETIELKVVHGRDLGLVKVDQGQLEQVIINLAVNARDAMPGGGTLTIATSNVTQGAEPRPGREVMPPGDYVQIEVRDTGTGIPKENLERIFEPFFSTKEVGSGTGLGLSTVYGIVKQTGGFVFVESEAQKGACFAILLPRLESEEAAAAVKPESAEPQAARDLTGAGTVLLVEDEDPVRMFSARALRNKGYKVIEAKSGEDALDKITSGAEAVDLIVTDVVMPRMDGPSLVKEVRALHPDMKVIFISGYTEDAFRKRLGDEGGIHFLPKPFSLKQLAGKVKEVMVAGLP